MKLLTIFTAPKPFVDPHIRIIQWNAIQSWVHLGEEVEVILVGDEPGMAEAASELGVRQLTDVARTPQGTPLVSSIFAQARRASLSPLLAYTNADMLFLPDLVQAAGQVVAQADRFLLIGQRWDLDVCELLDFSTGWDTRLRRVVQSRGRLHPPAGSDYFVFPRSCFADIPDFAVGRSGWDNWMIYYAWTTRMLTIDATPAVRAIHQSHNYGHLPGGVPHYDLEESEANRRLAGGKAHLYLILDANWQLVDGKIRPSPASLERLLRRAERRLYPEQGQATGVRKLFIRILRRLRRRIDPTRE
jgi:hypothetical protein